MPRLQRINHNGQLAAVVIAGQAILDDTLADTHRRHVQAMCLYALEIAERQRPGPYTDAAAEQYAHQALAHRG
jgi:hypothetical protein